MGVKGWWLMMMMKKQELANITDEAVYAELQANDINMGRWIEEDPSLRDVQRWIRSRRQC